MYKYSYVIIIPLLCIFSLTWSLFNHSSNLLDLYDGIPYFGNRYVVILHYYLFACYSFLVFNKSEKYTSGYGIYVVLRVQSKMKIIMQMVYQTLLFVIISEGIKVIVYICMLLLVYGTITLETKDISAFVNMFFIHACYLFLFLLIQLVIEWFVDGKLALIFVQMSYLLLLALSDFMYRLVEESYWNMLFLPNFLMYDRLHAFYIFDFMHLLVLYILVILLVLLCVFITKKAVHKKNWL